jgi:hypothetical protein
MVGVMHGDSTTADDNVMWGGKGYGSKFCYGIFALFRFLIDGEKIQNTLSTTI